MGEDQIGLHALGKIRQCFLDLAPLIGKETIAEGKNFNAMFSRSFEKSRGTGAGFGVPLPISGEHTPMNTDIGLGRNQIQDGAATSDFEIVAMGAQAKDGLNVAELKTGHGNGV